MDAKYFGISHHCNTNIDAQRKVSRNGQNAPRLPFLYFHFFHFFYYYFFNFGDKKLENRADMAKNGKKGPRGSHFFLYFHFFIFYLFLWFIFYFGDKKMPRIGKKWEKNAPPPPSTGSILFRGHTQMTSSNRRWAVLPKSDINGW
jgi:hypothetical protein